MHWRWFVLLCNGPNLYEFQFYFVSVPDFGGGFLSQLSSYLRKYTVCITTQMQAVLLLLQPLGEKRTFIKCKDNLVYFFIPFYFLFFHTHILLLPRLWINYQWVKISFNLLWDVKGYFRRFSGDKRRQGREIFDAAEVRRKTVEAT